MKSRWWTESADLIFLTVEGDMMENAWKWHHGRQLLHLGEAHEILPRRLSTVRAAYRSILGQNEIDFFFCRAWSAPSEVTSNVEIKNRETVDSPATPKSVIKILDKTRTQSWYYLEHYQERPMAFGKAIPDQKGSNLWVARSLISCKWAAFSRSNCMCSYILLYASLYVSINQCFGLPGRLKIISLGWSPSAANVTW